MNLSIQKALTFRASSIGDCLMGAYLLANIHEQFPIARLGIVVGSKGAMIRDLLAQYPWIEVIEVNRFDPAGLWKLWKGWRTSDLVVTQYAGKAGGVFSLPSKIAARLLARHGGMIGFVDASVWNWLYDALVPFDGAEAPAQMERRALSAAGIATAVPYPKLSYTSNDSLLERFNLTKSKYVVVHVFSGSKKRGLSPDNRHALVEALAQELPSDTEIVLTGSAAEKEEAIAAAQGTRAKVIAEKTTLQEMLTLLGESISVVAVDTGVAHMAAQLGKPVAVLTSCLGAQWWRPEQYGPNAHVEVFTQKSSCGEVHKLVDYPPCLNSIDMKSVARTVTVA